LPKRYHADEENGQVDTSNSFRSYEYGVPTMSYASLQLLPDEADSIPALAPLSSSPPSRLVLLVQVDDLRHENAALRQTLERLTARLGHEQIADAESDRADSDGPGHS